MSGIRLTVSVDDVEARLALQRLALRARDLTPVMTVVGQTIRTSVVKNFEAGGRPRWPRTKSLSVYLSRKIAGKDVTSTRGRRNLLRAQQGKQTLVDTARLMKSISVKAGRDSVAVGTNVIYGPIHQLGGKAGRGKKVTIPARPYLAVQPEDWTEIGRLLVRHLEGERR